MNEAGEFGVVVAGVVVVKAGGFVDDLAGIAIGDVEGGGVIVFFFFVVMLLAEGGIAVVVDDITVAVGHDGGGAEVVGMVVIEDGVENRRRALTGELPPSLTLKRLFDNGPRRRLAIQGEMSVHANRRGRDSNPRYGLTRTLVFETSSLSRSDTSPPP